MAAKTKILRTQANGPDATTPGLGRVISKTEKIRSYERGES
jgi:hypothetical protein